MATQKLGGGVHGDIDAVLEGPEQRRRQHGVVDNHRKAVPMGDIGDLAEVRDIVLGIAHGFQIYQPGVLVG
jgi:hypothetical protein